jgi:hypothetical protein
VVPKMSLTPGRIWRGAPSVGDDTTDILSGMLNFSETAIEKLYHEKVIHRTEPFTEPQVCGEPLKSCASAHCNPTLRRTAALGQSATPEYVRVGDSFRRKRASWSRMRA